MTYSVLPEESATTVGIDDFLDFVELSVRDDTNDDDLLLAAPGLQALARNRSFLGAWVEEALKKELALPDTGYVSQVVLLGASPRFYTRAVMWFPKDLSSLDQEYDDDHASYEIPHDHNFTFLTVGYAGSGYDTDIYEYEPGAVAGVPGEPAAVSFLESTSLTQGKVMMYRESRDIHVQHHSKDVSVSVNLIPVRRRYDYNQRTFDLKKMTVSQSVPERMFAQSSFLCTLASVVGDENSWALLEKMALTHRAPQTRRLAYVALAASGRSIDDYAEHICRDESPYVRQLCTSPS